MTTAPPIYTPMIDEKGLMTKPWAMFFSSLSSGANTPTTITLTGDVTGHGTKNIPTTVTKVNGHALAPVAVSGSFNDLSDAPDWTFAWRNAYNNYLVTPLVAPDLPQSGMSVDLPGGTAVINGKLVTFAAISRTFGNDVIHDVWLNADGSYTDEEMPANNYIALPRYTDKLHLWNIQAINNAITGIRLPSNTYPTIKRPTDKAKTIDQFNQFFYLNDVTTPWAASTAVAYRDVLVTAAGNVYIVFQPGTTGVSAPTSHATGVIPDGDAILFYYCQDFNLGMFRYAYNNGLQWYFTNLGLERVCHRVCSDGVAMSVYIKKYIMKGFEQVLNDRTNSFAYVRGMMVNADGFVWLCTVAGTTAATAVAFTGSRPHTIGQIVAADGGCTWRCVQESFAAVKWIWYDTDTTFLVPKAPDSDDSYAATFITLIARYIEITGDYGWLYTQSPHSGMTYFAVFEAILNANLLTQIANNLTKTFQGDINPKDGTTYNIQFLEDNCESYTGFRAAAAIYRKKGDLVNALICDDPANPGGTAAAQTVARGLRALFDDTYLVNVPYFGASAATFYYNNHQTFYPNLQCQFFPELHNVESFTDDMFGQARYWVSTVWESWWNDKSKDLLPNCLFAYMAAKKWQDIEKASSIISMAERYYMTDGSLIISEYAHYLDAKDSLVGSQKLCAIDNGRVVFEDQYNRLFSTQAQIMYKSPLLNFKVTTSLCVGTTRDDMGTFIPYEVLLYCATGNTITVAPNLKVGTTLGGTEILGYVNSGVLVNNQFRRYSLNAGSVYALPPGTPIFVEADGATATTALGYIVITGLYIGY